MPPPAVAAGAAGAANVLPPQERPMLPHEIYQYIAAKIEEPGDAMHWRLASKVTHRAGVDAVEHVVVDEPTALLDALKNYPRVRKMTLVDAAFPPEVLRRLAQLTPTPTIALALRFPNAEPGQGAGNTHVRRALKKDRQVAEVNSGASEDSWPERQRMVAALHAHGLRGPETAADSAVFDAQDQDNSKRRRLAF